MEGRNLKGRNRGFSNNVLLFLKVFLGHKQILLKEISLGKNMQSGAAIDAEIFWFVVIFRKAVL